MANTYIGTAKTFQAVQLNNNINEIAEFIGIDSSNIVSIKSSGRPISINFYAYGLYLNVKDGEYLVKGNTDTVFFVVPKAEFERLFQLKR